MSKTPTPTQIIHDAPALIRSTLTTLIALTVTVAGLCTVLVSLPGVPDSQRMQIAAVGAAAVAFGTALRQGYAWLDKNNVSFGRVDMSLLPENQPQPADNVVSDSGDYDTEVTSGNSTPDVPAPGTGYVVPDEAPPPAGPDDVVTADDAGNTVGNKGMGA